MSANKLIKPESIRHLDDAVSKSHIMNYLLQLLQSWVSPKEIYSWSSFEMQSFEVNRVSDETVKQIIETLNLANIYKDELPELTRLKKFPSWDETLHEHIDLHVHRRWNSLFYFPSSEIHELFSWWPNANMFATSWTAVSNLSDDWSWVTVINANSISSDSFSYVPANQVHWFANFDSIYVLNVLTVTYPRIDWENDFHQLEEKNYRLPSSFIEQYNQTWKNNW